MVGGHEQGTAVLPHVVDHEAGAEEGSAGGDGGDAGNLVTPLVSLGAGDVVVARPGAVRRGEVVEAAVAHVDAGQGHRLLDEVAVAFVDLDLHEDVVTGDGWGPELVVDVVVIGGEGPDEDVPVSGGHREQAVGRQFKSFEGEVDGGRVLGDHAEPPHERGGVKAFPRAGGGGGHAHVMGDGVAIGVAVGLSPMILGIDCREVEAGNFHDLDRLHGQGGVGQVAWGGKRGGDRAGDRGSGRADGERSW